MAIKQYFFVILFNFVFFLEANAQETTTKLPLSEVLLVLEKQYNIQFNYAEDAVSNIVIIAPSQTMQLNDLLAYLEDESGLTFTLTGDNMVLVISRPKDIELQKLSEVVVSSYIIKGINKLSNGAFEIDVSQFNILPGLIDTDILQAAQAFPGIQSSKETVSNINVRGGTHDQNLMLWDDIKMYQSGHFFGLISMFNPQITQHVMLTKNGSDVSLTDGVSGTISMKTDNQVSEKFKGNIGVNFIDANGFADVPISEKSSLQIAARKSISDLAQTPTYENFFERISQNTEVENNAMSIINSDKQFDFYDASLRWIYKINETEELRINFITVANQLVFDENIIDNAIEVSRQSSLKQNSIAGAIQYTKQWNPNFETIFEGYETDYKLKSINSNLLETQRFLQENVVSETSLKLKTNYTFNERLQWQNGYHFVETKVTNLDDVDNPLFKLLVSEVVRTHGLFSQINYKSKNRKTNLSAGLRHNYIGKFKKHILEPRISLSHKLFNHFTVEALGEFKHQNTSQVINFQNDFLGIEKRRWQLSNDATIPVIRSRQASVGFTFNKRGWLLSGEAYYKNVKGITTQSQGFQNRYEFVKTDGEYKAKGLDFIVRKRLNNFNTWLSYSFIDSEYTFNELPENSFPSNYNIRHVASLGANYTLNQLKLSLGMNWDSGRPKTNPVSGNEIVDGDINFEATNSAEIQEYFRVDVSALYDFKLSQSINANIGVSVWNLLDRKNIINSFHRIDNNIVTEAQQESLGITPNLIFRVSF